MALAACSRLRLRKFVAFGGLHVVHMYRRLVEDRAPRGRLTVDRPSVSTYRYRAMMRAGIKVIAILQAHYGIIGLAELAGSLDNGLEIRPDIGRRGCDHPQDIAAPGLIDQRLGKVARLRLHLVEQPDIFDGDSSLIGKGCDQLDLLFGERSCFRARQDDDADWDTFAQHRHAKDA